MAQATFYLLDTIGDGKLLPFVCQQVRQYFRQGQRVLVHAADQAQAEALDELLWQLPADAFVPHNLTTEGGYGSPVELSWQGQISKGPRQVLVNLSQDVPIAAKQAQWITDFVPQQEQLRAQARERFKQYRQFGINIHTEQAEFADNV